MKRPWLRGLLDVALAVVGASALARLVAGAGGAAVWTAIVTLVVVAVSSKRVATAATLVGGTIVALVVAVRTSIHGPTFLGLPTATTLRNAVDALHDSGLKFGHLPLVASAGVVLLCAVVAGISAVVAGALPGAARVVPCLVLVSGSILALPTTGAAALGVWFAVLAAATVVLSSPTQRGWLAVAVATAAGVVCVVGVGNAAGVPTVAPGGSPAVGVPPSALTLVSNLTGLETRDANLVLFTATTPIPTYWQVASLSVLTGNTWVPDPQTAAALAGKTPPVASTPTASGTRFTTTVTIANLSSRLLPVPPSTVAVSGATLSAQGAALDQLSTVGQRYRATAVVSAPSAESGSTSTTAGSAFTLLPTIPGAVTTLAELVTAQASSPLAKAEALTNWFRSGRFHYSLRSTTASLTAFLTTSHTGSCEQFAGAFAVLARAVDLPTRVAVGFSTGVRDSAGQMVIRGRDAHAWPEVLIGGQWLSFEPTPQLPAGEFAPPAVVGVTAQGSPNPTGVTTIPSSIPSVSTPILVPLIHTPTGSFLGSIWLWVGAISLTAVAIAAMWWRRRRARRSPEEQLLRAWARIDRAMARSGRARPRWRTPTGQARELIEMSHLPADSSPDLRWIATLLERTNYGSSAVLPTEAARADELSRRLAKTMRSEISV